MTFYPIRLPDAPDFRFYFNILVDPSSVARFNKLPFWGDENWRQLEKYVENLAAHGQKAVTAFIVEDPFNSVTGFPVRSVVEWKYPWEWELDSGKHLTFDFSAFDRFVDNVPESRN